MKKRRKTIEEKEAIIAEYLTGEIGFRKLGLKYDVDSRLVHYWVMTLQNDGRKEILKNNR